MGVKKLTKFLDEKRVVKKYNNFDDYIRAGLRECRKNKLNKTYIVGLDAYQCIFKFLYAKMDYIVGILNQILRFMSHKIIPVYIFDGKPPKEKKTTLFNRYKKKERIKSRIAELLKKKKESNDSNIDVEIQRLDKKNINIKIDYINKLKRMFNIMGIPYITAVGEADTLCAELYKRKIIDVCMSEDMDLLVFGCDRLIKLDKGQVYEYDKKYILNRLSLSTEQFTDMAIISGCDYSRQIPISRVSTSMLYNLIKIHRNFENVLKILGKNKYEKLLESYTSARKIYQESGNKEIIPSDFQVCIRKVIDVKRLTEFLSRNTNFKFSYYSKIKKQLGYINKLIERNYYVNPTETIIQ